MYTFPPNYKIKTQILASFAPRKTKQLTRCKGPGRNRYDDGSKSLINYRPTGGEMEDGRKEMIGRSGNYEGARR
jgi:hypothetical protein